MNQLEETTETFERFWQSTNCEAVIFDMDGTLVDNMEFSPANMAGMGAARRA